MGQILHGSARTREAVRRALQHSHVWTALADQEFWRKDAVLGMRSCLRPLRAASGSRWPWWCPRALYL